MEMRHKTRFPAQKCKVYIPYNTSEAKFRIQIMYTKYIAVHVRTYELSTGHSSTCIHAVNASLVTLNRMVRPSTVSSWEPVAVGENSVLFPPLSTLTLTTNGSVHLLTTNVMEADALSIEPAHVIPVQFPNGTHCELSSEAVNRLWHCSWASPRPKIAACQEIARVHTYTRCAHFVSTLSGIYNKRSLPQRAKKVTFRKNILQIYTDVVLGALTASCKQVGGGMRATTGSKSWMLLNPTYRKWKWWVSLRLQKRVINIWAIYGKAIGADQACILLHHY